MHRSGTTLVSKILHDAGIFMGVWQDHNAESLPFLSLNQQMLAQQGADWLHPAVPERQLPHMPAPRDLYHWHWDIRSRWQRWQAAWRPRPWGWKDPRNTFTLPRWLECYPQARVLVVQREAEDVVRSLQQRNSRAGEVQDDALEDETFARALTHTYQRQAGFYQAQLGERLHTLHYEDMRQQNAGAISAWEDFIGLRLRASLQKYIR